MWFGDDVRFWNMQPDNWRGRMGVFVYKDDDTDLERPVWSAWIKAGQLRVFPAREGEFQVRVVAGLDSVSWRRRFPAAGVDAWCSWRPTGDVGWGAGVAGRAGDDG